MNTSAASQPLMTISRYPLALAMTLMVLASVITLATLQLRTQTRLQLVARDAEVFHAVALMHADDPEVQLLGIEHPANQLAIILKTSDLKAVSRGEKNAVVHWRVLGARLFNDRGEFVGGIPDNVAPASLPAEYLLALRRLEPRATFRNDQSLSSISLSAQTQERAPLVPILEINVPLHTSAGGQLAGIAQFLIEAQSMSAQLARLDRNLIWQAFVAFLVSGTLLTVALTWSFRRLREGNRLLAEQAEHLRQANLELALAAKTNALGAVTAHLLHGLKNPLSGLQNFMKGLRGDEKSLGDYESAVASTRRMQAMINQVVNILRESQGTAGYEITAEEIMELVRDQVQSCAQEAGVVLELVPPKVSAWPNRVAHLIVLVLTNLIQNAVQASPREGRVRVTTEQTARSYTWRVTDNGAGFPTDLEPFSPCQSRKIGGTGIGLALSKQLANHLQAQLELAANSAQGCVFSLSVPNAPHPNQSERAAYAKMG